MAYNDTKKAENPFKEYKKCCFSKSATRLWLVGFIWCEKCLVFPITAQIRQNGLFLLKWPNSIRKNAKMQSLLLTTHSSVPCEIWYKKLFWVGRWTEKWHNKTQKWPKTPSWGAKNAVFHNLAPDSESSDVLDVKNGLFFKFWPKLGKTGFFTKMTKFNKEKRENSKPAVDKLFFCPMWNMA